MLQGKTGVDSLRVADTTIRSVAPALTTGQKLTPKEVIQQAKSALQLTEIVGHVQI